MTNQKVELERYMGDWRVIANIPTFYEKNAYDAIESYRLNPDGSIFNSYECHRGGFDGQKKRITAKAWIANPETNAKWKIQFVWPFKMDYEILEVSPDYSYTVVGHPSKKYVWIMARAPRMDENLLQGIYSRLGGLGYDTARIERVPQSARNVH